MLSWVENEKKKIWHRSQASLKQMSGKQYGKNKWPDLSQRLNTYLLICATKGDSNQPAHLRSLTRVFIVRMKNLCNLDNGKCASEDSVQTDQMHRLIWIFAGRICSKVSLFLTLRLSYMRIVSMNGETHDQNAGSVLKIENSLAIVWKCARAFGFWFQPFLTELWLF